MSSNDPVAMPLKNTCKHKAALPTGGCRLKNAIPKTGNLFLKQIAGFCKCYCEKPWKEQVKKNYSIKAPSLCINSM